MSVLSRPNDFRAFVPDSASSPISSGITYGMFPTTVRSVALTEADLLQRMVDALHVGSTTSTTRIQSIFEPVHARFTTTPLTSHLDFSAADLAGIQQSYNAIQQLYQSTNVPRDRQIADRITVLHLDALAEDQHILPSSLRQFAAFFLAHPDLRLPKITLTPDSTLRARWIRGPRNFIAIEFTGEPLAKLVSEIPREDNLTATHFSIEPIKNIVSIARALGASFTR